ncbi:MAG TPA: cyclic nucleotide-binding domain-containing protein [Thermoanaerobaculia bacterium]|nr:cyclic nucleotide-binding domain-containing protein [Thermoanaerobaculia bacterium]
MVFKKMFRSGGGGPREEEYSIEDLIVLERYEEAEQRLQEKVKKNLRDLYSHLRLAEVHVATGRPLKAVDEFSYVADCYAEDGFYDKAIAALSKAAKLAPLEESLPKRIARLQKQKQLEHSRSFFVEGLTGAATGGALERLSPVELQIVWKRLAPTALVQQLAPEQLKRLASGLDLRAYETGRTIAVRGGTDRLLLLLVSGLVEAVLEGAEAGQGSLRTFTTGDLLGDWPLLEQRPWPATLVAREPVTALVLTRPGLEKALHGNPDPRALLEALRSQRNDQALALAVRRFLRPSEE